MGNLFYFFKYYCRKANQASPMRKGLTFSINTINFYLSALSLFKLLI